ncbi:MAG: isocitrate lyase/phosphoenolpyruvate mutase family protein [Candidatus Sulfotelmatobacter sp.]
MATSSAASASAIGRRDGGLTRDEALARARLIVDATDLPVSVDLEKGFGDAPEVVAETIRLAAEVGVVGCTVEDATGNQDSPLYDVRFAVERIAAAAQAARALQFPFILTARVHSFLYAAPNLDENISRLQAFEEAGADVLFAPGLPDLAAVGAVCGAVSKPVNFMVESKENHFPWVISPRRSQAHQPCDLTPSRGNDRFARRCMRGKRRRPVRFPRPVRDHAGAQQTPAELTALWTRNAPVASVRMVGSPRDLRERSRAPRQYRSCLLSPFFKRFRPSMGTIPPPRGSDATLAGMGILSEGFERFVVAPLLPRRLRAMARRVQ